jgi:hypothetical protein
VSRNSFSGPLAISAVPGAYRLAVKVYPKVQSLPAEEIIEQLPPVGEKGVPAPAATPGQQRERKAGAQGKQATRGIPQ